MQQVSAPRPLCRPQGWLRGGVQLLTQTLVFAYRKAEIMDRVLIEKKSFNHFLRVL